MPRVSVTDEYGVDAGYLTADEAVKMATELDGVRVEGAGGGSELCPEQAHRLADAIMQAANIARVCNIT